MIDLYIGDVQDIAAEIDTEMNIKELAGGNQSPDPTKKGVCQFISNSYSKKSKGSPD